MRRMLLATVVALLLVVMAIPAGAGPQRNFRAHLNGDGAGIETRAQGQAIFQFSKDGSELGYKLIVAGLDNLWMAHIHVAAEPGGDGPPRVWLLPDAPPPPAGSIAGTTNGVVAEGAVMEGDDGVSISFEELREAIAEGRAYVNVHTNDFTGPPNTGPGDFPGGEIRGTVH